MNENRSLELFKNELDSITMPDLWERCTAGYRTFRVSVKSPVKAIVKDQESMLLLPQVPLYFALLYHC